MHRNLSPDSDEDIEAPPPFKYNYHPTLTDDPTVGENTSWDPFESRIDFDFAWFHFVVAESSAGKINQAINMWAATIVQQGGSPPWSNAKEMYQTIDEIQHGDAPWKMFRIRYQGPLPAGVPPKWMTVDYELCLRDTRQVLHHQLSTVDYCDKIDYRPYQQFNGTGKRVYSNLMSGDWAWSQAEKIAEDEATHGAFFLPIVSGSDKTTVSVATGHQEFHPVYMSPGNLTNIARRAHGNSVLPVAFLPIPKAKRRHRSRIEFQCFSRQMYHACLARVFTPLKPGMTTPDIVKCPDGHWRKVIYGLGPYIADYPEQVWLSGIVQGWCPKCDAPPGDLDRANSLRRTQAKSDFIISTFDPATVWDDFGIRSDITPFTHDFPRADIHELLSPDLLHQVIKGTFKDHIMAWVNDYLIQEHGETDGKAIIDDIDCRIAVVPAFPGLRRFPEGRDFQQWTGDDSKALMKLYLPSIAGYVPSDMVRCLAAFLDFCYLVRRNSICDDTLGQAQEALDRFHHYRNIFILTGVRDDVSLPRQHSLLHYLRSIRLFGSPNGLCSSITESKHIPAVKKPWRRSNRYRALKQMLCTNRRSDKMCAARRHFASKGMMEGTTLSYTAMMLRGEEPQPPPVVPDGEADDHGAATGPKVVSSVELAATHVISYPKCAEELGAHIEQPRLHELICRFLYEQENPNSDIPGSEVALEDCPPFDSNIRIFHSAIACFFAPSNLCGAGGMYREHIRSCPSWFNSGPRRDTVLVITDSTVRGMAGMTVGRVLLFFSFPKEGARVPCALIHWMVPIGHQCNPDTGLWMVKPEYLEGNRPHLVIVHLDSIARATHLIGVYGSTLLPDDFHFSYTLDSFRAFYINKYADHHMHEFLH
ncbi:hypothetical protein FIBSPDRAFT_911331 [Athelia psychrophila]|uniref:Uncharacterized protein n=1 Tax=Athelia psychrophila TaxID=1759441 RepID=A0A166IC17_9AGAM|nr:hypothetical protein FIBSPDRAFT_911331 [Fibularhizoctonia sp. CBS 109695]